MSIDCQRLGRMYKMDGRSNEEDKASHATLVAVLVNPAVDFARLPFLTPLLSLGVESRDHDTILASGQKYSKFKRC